MAAPGRYCLAICYCGQCPHYKPNPWADPLGPAAMQLSEGLRRKAKRQAARLHERPTTEEDDE